MLILGIETSCDETGVSIIKADKKSKKVKLLSNVLSSSLPLHSETGGIIPENAAREQLRYVIPALEDSLKKAKVKITDIDAIAITYGPGLIGSLLVGVETAKTLSFVHKIPLIPTNHLVGHIYANFIEDPSNKNAPIFPSIGLVVSGGHTDLILIKGHGTIKWIGGTRDDAAGEAMDKIGRLLNLPYPGGPYIEKAALKGRRSQFKFPRPMIGSKDFDFSFSGLKTAVYREVHDLKLNEQDVSDISLEVQDAIVDVLISKTLKAANKYKARSILLGGGVSANQKLRDELIKNSKVPVFIPPKTLCTDNGAMIGAAAFFNYREAPWQKVEADPGLHF